MRHLEYAYLMRLPMPFTIRPYRCFPVPCTLVLAIFCAPSVWAGFEEGMAAYERGDDPYVLIAATRYLLGRGVP